MIYIEDYLQHYVETIGVADNNKQILESINKQCNKGTALTDRQYELVKSKLLEVAELELFTGNEPTRMPLREIDRSKYIKLVSHADMIGEEIYESYKADWKWIKVRFPFAKKTIMDLETIVNRHRKIYSHAKGSHEHFFKFMPNVVLDLLDVFSKKDFEIDESLLKVYQETADIKNNPKSHVPGLWNGEFQNFKNDISHLTNELSIVQLIDRKKQLGIEYITGEIPSGLTGEICKRENNAIIVSPQEYSIDKVISSIYELDRFPLLVVLDQGRELDQTSRVYNSIKYLVPDEQQCVLTRVDSSDEYNFNDLIKDKKLNNWLDSNTKVVYISKNKLPKLLIKENWVPQCTLMLTSFRTNTFVSTYINDTCDLTIAHDTEQSYFWRSNSAYM